ncbi:hypothetical protein [Streptomonospora salina]|uniref:Uncharacterized protein n=1 Tax=Streptomonospora salina TaxID=104205 RepID=A0A841EAD1_9ACTN|nr:hypothetical protein [Streptomonospora salina]MBB6000987.1 hypothetical protein [Streptomonospora salina]
MEDQLCALGLVLHAVRSTTRSIGAAVAQFQAEGHELRVREEDVARLCPPSTAT